jgi:hypothetical protein
MRIAEQHHRATRLDHRVQPAQRLAAVHPMKRPPHHHQVEPPERRTNIGRAPLHQPDRHITRRLTRHTQHFRLRVHRHHLPGKRGKRQSQLPRLAPQIQHLLRLSLWERPPRGGG